MMVSSTYKLVQNLSSNLTGLALDFSLDYVILHQDYVPNLILPHFCPPLRLFSFFLRRTFPKSREATFFILFPSCNFSPKPSNHYAPRVPPKVSPPRLTLSLRTVICVTSRTCHCITAHQWWPHNCSSVSASLQDNNIKYFRLKKKIFLIRFSWCSLFFFFFT